MLPVSTRCVQIAHFLAIVFSKESLLDLSSQVWSIKFGLAITSLFFVLLSCNQRFWVIWLDCKAIKCYITFTSEWVRICLKSAIIQLISFLPHVTCTWDGIVNTEISTVVRGSNVTLSSTANGPWGISSDLTLSNCLQESWNSCNLYWFINWLVPNSIHFDIKLKICTIVVSWINLVSSLCIFIENQPL